LAYAFLVEDRKRSSTTISLAVDYARPHREVLDRGGDLRKPCAEIVAIAREQPDTPVVAPREDAEAIVLDFVNPARARRWLLSRAGQAWFEREATMTQHETKDSSATVGAPGQNK
jgi:antitoxin (DNA-binding transcriptional repressor) of toxin-antitoxin stability system